MLMFVIVGLIVGVLHSQFMNYTSKMDWKSTLLISICLGLTMGLATGFNLVTAVSYLVGYYIYTGISMRDGK